MLGLFSPQEKARRLGVYPKRLRGCRPRKQLYTGGQKKNHTVSTTLTTKAAALLLTTLMAVTLTVGEALVVARAASVATIMLAEGREPTRSRPIYPGEIKDGTRHTMLEP